METCKSNQNNPNPIPFVKIKTEPQHVSESINTAKGIQPEVAILSEHRNYKPNNNPNPLRFEIKQETSAEASDNCDITYNSIDASTSTNSVACQTQEETMYQEIYLNKTAHLNQRIESLIFENVTLQQENEAKTLRIKQIEEEQIETRKQSRVALIQIIGEITILKKRLLESDLATQIPQLERSFTEKRVLIILLYNL